MTPGDVAWLHHSASNVHALTFEADSLVMDVLINDYDMVDRRMSVFDIVDNKAVVVQQW